MTISHQKRISVPCSGFTQPLPPGAEQQGGGSPAWRAWLGPAAGCPASQITGFAEIMKIHAGFT